MTIWDNIIDRSDVFKVIAVHLHWGMCLCTRSAEIGRFDLGADDADMGGMERRGGL